ncbi:MAG TPA: hypothetical protein VK190_04735 [Pseudoneobacillus sp.]|nr:hypothetical protein [Pseudoneobacillus sp.]
MFKYRLCTYIWSWGTYDNIEIARNVAETIVFPEEPNVKRLMIRNAETDEVVEILERG